MRYTLFEFSGDIIAEGTNKQELIKRARHTNNPATVINDKGEILFENKQQRTVNNH